MKFEGRGVYTTFPFPLLFIVVCWHAMHLHNSTTLFFQIPLELSSSLLPPSHWVQVRVGSSRASLFSSKTVMGEFLDHGCLITKVSVWVAIRISHCLIVVEISTIFMPGADPIFIGFEPPALRDPPLRTIKSRNRLRSAISIL